MNTIRNLFIFLPFVVSACVGEREGDSENQSSAMEAGESGGRTSDHCKLDGDCDSGLEPICLRDATLPAGYCTSECVLNDDCDGESVCVYFDEDDRSGICSRMCRADGDCESDQACFAITGASVCLID